MIEHSPELARLLAKQESAELLEQARRRQLRRGPRAERRGFLLLPWTISPFSRTKPTQPKPAQHTAASSWHANPMA